MALNREEILSIFKETGALLEGHFILTSGLHSECSANRGTRTARNRVLLSSSLGSISIRH